MTTKMTYAAAGVDIDKGNAFVQAVKRLADTTRRPGVMGDIGGFGGLFSLNTAQYERPVLVASTDGVGTKLKIAFLMDKHDTVGIDLVAMCVNDVVVQGARPLFFLDYMAMGELRPAVAEAILKGIAEGCVQARCALIGGETAEMPGLYQSGEYDLAGFTVGIVDNVRIIDGSEIRVGHRLIGMASSGLHSNGYSLVRKICFELLKLKVESHIPEFGKSLGEELLTPTRIYTETLLALIRDLPIHGLAHITGGGIPDNVLRVIPKACKVILHRNSWEVPPIFSFLQDAGKLDEAEMLRTFNNGIGMILMVPEGSAQEILERLRAMDEKAFLIGEVGELQAGDERIVWANP